MRLCRSFPSLPSPLAVVVSILITSCGGAQSAPLSAGLVERSPSMECLPQAPVPRDDMTRHMRFGWTLAEESFLVPPPELPNERGALDLQAWAGTELAGWLQRKSHTIEAARHELDAAAEESREQRIMGGAIVGLMYEDVARVLATIPPPDELDSEPEIQEVYRQVMRSEARPFLEHARRAYHACAMNGMRPAQMQPWARFCAGRRDGLPEEDRPMAPNSTTVEVIADP